MVVLDGDSDEIRQIYERAKSAGETPGFSGPYRGVDLSGFDFRGGVRNRNLFLAVMIGSDLQGATLKQAILSKTDWACANLRATNLEDADMREANFYSTDFRRANLARADLRLANLNSAHFIDSILTDANVAGARFGRTTFAGIDLSTVQGLDDTLHIQPSTIGSDTLRLTASGLVDAGDDRVRSIVRFLRGTGVDDAIIETFRGWLGKPV